MSRTQPFRALLEEAFSDQGQALPRTLLDLPPMSARLLADVADAAEVEVTQPLPVLLPSLPSMPSMPALRGPPPATTRARTATGRRRRAVLPATVLPVVVAEAEPADFSERYRERPAEHSAPRRHAKAPRPSGKSAASPAPPSVQRAPPRTSGAPPRTSSAPTHRAALASARPAPRAVPPEFYDDEDALPPSLQSLVLTIDVVEPRAYSEKPRAAPAPGEAQKKAHELYLAALDDMAGGNVASALIHLKLAGAYDPKNGVVSDLIKQLEKKSAMKAARPRSTEAEHGPREELLWVRSRR